MPISAHDVHKAMRELGDLRYSAVSLPDALRRIVDTTHELFRVDGAGLMLIDADQLLRNVAVSDERVGALEELQIQYEEGPCIDAFQDKDVVHAADLTEEQRWPSFSPAAVGRGLRAVLASPIPYNQQAIGVVAVFSAARRPWSPEAELAIIAFTDLAALLIANTMQGEEQGELAKQLQQALDARVVIEQAKGALVAREGLTPVDAFERLRTQARSERRRVADVAGELITALQRS
ncbi:MAG TPA: GAF and ANTAR domain-containing protein [Actinomycetes bacterium]|nr:GAF and ANTAR domain-containing protein [Actinomycetes bacterium]